jgi:glycerophosphoryl diester phosphodiesterase
MKVRTVTLLIILAIVLVLAGAGAFWARPIQPHVYYSQFEHFPLVIAHQGGDGLRPGDTLAAFENAATLDVDVLEMDAHLTQDGHVVVMHDETVDRTTDGSGYIKEMTLTGLKTLDAGYNWSPDAGKTFPFRGQGIRVPTLEEVFQAFPGIPMNIEIKQAEPGMHAQLCALIRQYGRQESVLIASFHNAAMLSFRQDCPEVATSMPEDEVRPFVYLTLGFLGSLYRPEANAIQVPEESSGITIITPRFIRTAHGRGLRVEAWTINEKEDMRRFIQMGIDGIITDYPDRLIEVLEEE